MNSGMLTDLLRVSIQMPILRCWLVLVFVLLLPALPAQDEPAEEEEQLPTFAEMSQKIPTMEQLLVDDPVDWILIGVRGRTAREDCQVMVVQPVAQPGYDPPNLREKMLEGREKLRLSATRPKQEPGETDEDYKERLARLIDEAEYLQVAFPEDPNNTDPDAVASYRLNVRQHVMEIIHHEDLMLMRTDLLMNEGKLDKAFELLLVVERRASGWPGYAERRNRLLFEEAKVRVGDNQLEEALAFFEELHILDPQYQGLRAGMGNVIDTLIKDAEAAGDLRKARYYLLRLRGRDAAHPVAQSWVEDFSRRTEDLLKKAQAERAAGRHAEAFALATEAAGVWPPHPQLRSSYAPIAERYQVLDIGVSRLAGEKSAFFLPTEADRREESLLSTDLFQLRRFDKASYYESRIFEEWTPTDLGRQIVFTLRRRRSHWETNPVLTAQQVVESIGHRLRLQSPLYDERLATLVRSMEVQSPQKFVMNFNTVPVRPQAMFRIPVRDLPATSGVETAAAESAADELLLSKRFTIHQKTDDRAVYRRAIPQADRLSSYRVAEIVEKKYESSKDAVQALLRGDVSVLPRPPLWYVDDLEKDDRFFTEKYGVPTTHVLQFNPESKPLQNSEFRRALAKILDRQKILATTVLKDPDAKRGRVVSAPFPSTCYGYDSQYDKGLLDDGAGTRDLPLAFSLIQFTKKRFDGEIPELKMVCEPGEVILDAAKELVEQWEKLGIKVSIVEDSAETPADWDIVYRAVRMTEPVTDLWPFLTLKPDAKVEDLEHLPDWLRQQLIELEQSVDFNTSVRMLRGLHFRLNELVHVIPLWEIDEVIVIRKNIQGFPRGLIGPYHNVEQWKVTPWYSTNLL